MIKIPLCEHNVFVQPLLGHLGCLNLLDIVNNSAIHIGFP